MTERLAMTDDASSASAGLSALMDGECSPSELEGLCRQWALDGHTQDDWQTYHLIGDVLRSDDLAASRDDAFLAKLQQRLAAEPTVVAPLPAARTIPRAFRRWTAPLGAAAGVALVAGAVWMMRPQSEVASYQSLAAGSSGANAARANATVAAAQFERYLSAHKQFQPAAVVTPTGGYLRSAVYESNDR